MSRDQTLPLCLSRKDCVERDDKEAQGCADRTQATVAPKRMAPTRIMLLASEHMAGTSQAQARWHRNTGLRLSEGNLSGQKCNRGCYSRARTGGLHRWPTGSSRGPATAMSVPGARGEEGDEATMKRRDLRRWLGLTLDRDGHWHGAVCDTGAGLASLAVLQERDTEAGI